ncbi:MAG TPA: CAP domain-containing protein [Sphingomicrobium sp.]|nr:CAP domain-containing protein [Sphingomicrobium sp.]
MRFKRLAAILATVTAMPVAGAASAGAAPSGLEARLLALHNGERARVGSPALQWDPALAAAAAAYGPVLERMGRLEHSPRAGRPGQRENLWMGTRGAFSPDDMVGSWIAERAHFRPGVFPNVSRTGNWLDVSHYTQLIWRTTTHVGCAVHRGARYDFLVCRYSPPGNRDGTALS